MDKNNTLLVIGALVVAGIAIAIGLMLGGGANTPAGPAPGEDFSIEAPSASDHIRGSLDAEVIIVEYSDLECPYCKTYQETLTNVLEGYSEKQVAWIYRHFPLTSIHPKAFRESIASECAAELGGNDAFWTYTDRIYEITPSNNGLDLSTLPEIAEFAGLDREAFEECLDSNNFDEVVEAELEDAIQSGGTGTPYSVFVVGGGISEAKQTAINSLFAQARPGLVRFNDAGTLMAISGGLPEESITTLIDLLLAEEPTEETAAPTETTEESTEEPTETSTE